MLTMFEFKLLPQTETSFFHVIENYPENYDNTKITHNIDLKIDEFFNLCVKFEVLIMKNEKQFLQSDVNLYFSFSENSLNDLKDPNNGNFNFPKDLISHFISIAVGVNRGIILSKTKEINKEFLLPLIYISDVIKEDVIIEKSSIN